MRPYLRGVDRRAEVDAVVVPLAAADLVLAEEGEQRSLALEAGVVSRSILQAEVDEARLRLLLLRQLLVLVLLRLLGFGRIVGLYGRPSTLHQIHVDDRLGASHAETAA